MQIKFQFILLPLLFITLSCSSKNVLPPGLSDQMIQGQSQLALSPCPEKPNCVISFSFDEKHFSPPFKSPMPLDLAYKKIIKILESENSAKIIKKTKNYIYVQYQSSLFKFTDNVEFFFPSNAQIIHFRSASIKGHYDFNANLDRIEKIRFRFTQE